MQLDAIVAEAVENALRKTDIELPISLAAAKRLIAAVEKRAAEIGVNAVVAIADSGGNPIAVECMDNAFIASFDIAVKKAYTSVALKMSTKELSELSCPGGSLYGIQFTNQGRLVIFGGGQPLISKSGKILGGLGVSGGTEEQDTALCNYGRQLFENGNY